MQIILLTGNLTRDAESKVANRNGTNVDFISFSVACNEQVGDKKYTTYYEVTCAKGSIYAYLKKGQSVTVIGSFRQTTSIGSDGHEYHYNNVSAMRVELAGRIGQEPSNPISDL